MTDISANNKRIAKNTLLLYIRTLFVMLVSLYMSRVILEVLGVEDYGIYQVVGGLVSMFSVISGTLSSAISRFITFEIGSGNQERLKRIFSTSVIIQIILAVSLFVIAEGIAMWFIRTHMQIPPGRAYAAEWVLHCSLVTFCINLISIPYNACIIAHEHMKAFAYVSILEVLLRLAVCFLIYVSPIDKLIFYAILLTIVAVIVRFVYSIYCHRHFVESRGKLSFDKPVFREMLGFSGWSFFTNTNSILNNQGVNMLMNVHFGVAVNAARGIATQMENAVLQFVNNFTTAINPQITKSYAAGDKERMFSLVCRGAKFSYFAMLLMALPIICEADTILRIWLVQVPEYTVIFVQLSLVLGMCDCVGASGYTACIATGKMRRYALILTPIAFLEFPLTWIFFVCGAPVVSTYYLYILVKVTVVITRLFVMKDLLGFSPALFFKTVFHPIVMTTALAILPSLLILMCMSSSFLRLGVSVVAGMLSVILSSFYVGMTFNERKVFQEKIKTVYARMKHISGR